MTVTLLIEEGHAAYGVYWLVLELLRDCPGYRIEDNVKSLAWSVHCQDIALVDRVLHNYNLFEKDKDGQLFSPWLCSQMEAYDDRKKKLQEAGRRGAAKRFAPAASEDGQAIATPSVEDGQAIAPNITQYNVTRPNITQPTQATAEDWRDICRNQGAPIDPIELGDIASIQTEGHAQGYIMQVCIQYGMGRNVYNALCRITEDARVSNPTYRKFCTIVERIQKEKYKPDYPANFFLSKILG